MVATVAGIHLGIDTHANRPAANTCPDGSFYSCSTHGLIYKSNFAGNSWATYATLGITSVAGGDHGTLSGLADDDHPQYLLESLLDAKGDLIAASAADTPAKVTVGSDGSILRAASGASAGLEWRKDKLDATVAPTVNEDSGDGYSVGSEWIDVTGDQAYKCVDATVGAAVWIPFDSASGESWEGAWTAGTYTLGQIVEHNDVIYQVNAASTADEPPGTDWDVLYTAPTTGLDVFRLSGVRDDPASIPLGTHGDEFEYTSAATFAGIWVPQGSLTNYRINGSSIAFYSDNTAGRGFALDPGSNLPDDFEVAILVSGNYSRGNMFGVSILDTAGTGIGCSPYADGSGYTWDVTTFGYVGTRSGAAGPSQAQCRAPHWLALRRATATTWRFRWSADGTTWNTLVAADTKTVTNARLIYIGAIWNAGAIGDEFNIHRVVYGTADLGL